MSDAFMVGANYWPRNEPEIWSPFDAGVVRDDLEHAADIGLGMLRLLVPWNELQPAPETVDGERLDRIAGVASQAAAAGLRVLPALCGTLAGRDCMPAWARSFPDLFRGPLLDAQLVIARAVAERFAGMEALVAWDIGHAFSAVRPPRGGTVSAGEHATAPAAEPEIAAWGRHIARELRAGGIAATAGIAGDDLVEDTNVRLGSLCAPFAFASLQSSTVRVPFARSRLDPEAVPFLAMLTAAFAAKPVLVAAVGNHLTDEENAAYATAVLARLHADGRLGALWWSWRDAGPSSPPFERPWGIVRDDGSERQVAGALRAFAAQRRDVVASRDMPMIAATYYYRTLPDSTRTLYDAYLAFVDARRR